MMKYTRFFFAIAVIIGVTLSTGCLRKVKNTRAGKPILNGSGKVYLVPLGAFSDATVKELASYYQNKYGIPVQTLPHVHLAPETINPEREQLIAEQAVESMKQANQDLVSDPQAILIGLTEEDMYIAQYNWRFTFSWREQGRYAVVSSARMILPMGNEQVTEDQVKTRLRKMVTKNLGVLYYHLAQSDDPRSVLYRDIGGIRELDYMGEEF